MKLTAGARKQIPGQDFAGPGRSFPIEDENHAKAALSMAHYATDPEEIRRRVLSKYPQIDAKSATRAALLSKMQGGR
jgi:hypothetical protein